jgi:hypothetical protein
MGILAGKNLLDKKVNQLCKEGFSILKDTFENNRKKAF